MGNGNRQAKPAGLKLETMDPQSEQIANGNVMHHGFKGEEQARTGKKPAAKSIEARRGLGKALVMPEVAGLEQRQTAAEGLAVRAMCIVVLTRGI